MDNLLKRYSDDEVVEIYEKAFDFAERKINLLKRTYPNDYDDGYFEKHNYREIYAEEYINTSIYTDYLLDYCRKKRNELSNSII